MDKANVGREGVLLGKSRAVIGYSYTIMSRRRGLLLALLGLAAAIVLGGCVVPVLLPIASFTLAPSTGDVPLVVTFDASASQSPNGMITSYSWDFGDGTTGQGMVTSHLYQTEVSQTFTAALTVTDHLGQQDSVSADVSVEATPDEPALAVSVEFVWPFHYNASGEDAANLNDEYFTLQNTGDDIVDLSGWTVENERGVRFRFPNGASLMPNAMLTVHSGGGSNTASIFFWHSTEPIWNDGSDLAVLRDASGAFIHHYSYNSC